MRWSHVATAALTLLTAFACDQAAQTFPMPGRPVTVVGYVTVRTTDRHTIEVAVDEPQHPDGRADHLFHLRSNETLPAVDRSFPRARVELMEKELRVVAGGDEVITLALRSAPPRAESAPRSVRYTGYALQHETGKNAFMQVPMTRR